MSTKGQLPTISEAQIIGAKAEKCFGARCPENWRADSGTGTADFGIDYNVQAFENGQASDSFRVQLKGTEVPDLNAAGTQFAVQLKASTIRYYQRFTEPILLVLCDLSVNAKAVDCPLYYVWIPDELKRINAADLPDEQSYVTIHVPKNQVLDEDTNLSKDLAQFRVLAKIGETLHITLEKQSPSLDANARMNLLENLPRAFSERSLALMESMAEEPATAWPTEPAESMPWYISEIDRHIVNGSSDRAEEMLRAAEQKLDGATAIETGEYWHLHGRLHLLNLNTAEGCKAFKKATVAAPNNPKHLAAWAETQMVLSVAEDKPNDFAEIYPFLTSTTPEILGVKARLFAVENRDDEAEAILASFSGSEQLSTKAIFRTMRSRWQETIDICNEGLAAADVKEATRLLYLILKSRAQFHLAAGVDPSNSNLGLPLTGRVTCDLALLAVAWEGMTAALEGLRTSGWPANTEFVADVFCATASILQKEEEALNILMVGAEKRHDMPALQRAVESLAAQTERYDVALIANSRQPSNSLTKLHRTFILHRDRRDNDCVSFFDANLDSFNPDDLMYAETLAVAAISADRLVRTDLLRKWMPLFDATPELKVQKCLLHYALAVSGKTESRTEALNTLLTRFEEHGKPPSIAMQLFYDFNSHRPEEAEKIVDLAVVLASHRLLALDAVLQLSQAYTTLGRWNDLLALTSKERSRFSENQTLVAVEALALDRLGRTAEARDLLAPLISQGTSEEFILGAYIDIMTRCGFLEEAITAVEMAASAETVAGKKREHLRLLHNLVRAKDPSDLRAHDIAWRIGALTDPADEINEGKFLLAIAISPFPTKHDSALIEQYQRRLNDYITRFPHSTILRTGTFPENATPEEMMASLMTLMGDTPETLETRQRQRAELREQSSRSPFAWRPQFIDEARDVPQLWEVSKSSGGSDPALVLSTTQENWTPTPWSDMSERVPLMDLVSLLVAYDLGILNAFFKLFSKVAVPQRTMLNLGHLSDPVAGSFQGEKCRAIQQVLRQNFDQLLQPRAVHLSPEDKQIECIRSTLELKELAVQTPYLLYSDDITIRVFCHGDEHNSLSICTLDILAAMENQELLTTKEVAQKIGTLCSWGVGVVITAAWQIASLPETLEKVETITEGMDTIRNADLCLSIFDGMWGRAESKFIDMLTHASSLVVAMLYEHNMNAISVASLMAIWHERALCSNGAPQGPIDIPSLLLRNAAVLAIHAYPKTNRSDELWRIYIWLLEHIKQKNLDPKSLVDSLRIVAAAAANHDLNMRKLSEPSMRHFLCSKLKDGSAGKRGFLPFYEQWRKWLLNDFQITRPTFIPVWMKPLQPGYWREWGRRNTKAYFHWKTPPAELPKQLPGTNQHSNATAVSNYQQQWQRAAIFGTIIG